MSRSHSWLKFWTGPFHILYSQLTAITSFNVVTHFEKPHSPNLDLITQQNIVYYVRRNCQAIFCCRPLYYQNHYANKFRHLYKHKTIVPVLLRVPFSWALPPFHRRSNFISVKGERPVTRPGVQRSAAKINCENCWNYPFIKRLFLGSTRPFTNQRCINSTTKTGGSMTVSKSSLSPFIPTFSQSKIIHFCGFRNR